MTWSAGVGSRDLARGRQRILRDDSACGLGESPSFSAVRIGSRRGRQNRPGKVRMLAIESVERIVGTEHVALPAASSDFRARRWSPGVTRLLDPRARRRQANSWPSSD